MKFDPQIIENASSTEEACLALENTLLFLRRTASETGFHEFMNSLGEYLNRKAAACAEPHSLQRALRVATYLIEVPTALQYHRM